MKTSVARNIFLPPPPGNDFDQEHALNNSVARNIFCPLLQGVTSTKAKMPTAPACGTPRPDGMVGPLNCNAAHMPDVSRHSGGRCFRGTCGRTPALVIQSVGGRCPGNQKRNAFFMPSLVNSGCRLQSPQQKQGQAPERERERERERGCRRRRVGERMVDAGGGGRQKYVLYIVFLHTSVFWGQFFDCRNGF